MLLKTKTIFIGLVVLLFLIAIVGFSLGFFSGNSQVKQEFITKADLQKSPLVTINPKNPYYSAPLKEEEIPSGAVRLKVSQGGFQPAQFEVKAGQLVILVLTSVDDNQHSLFFEDETLRGISIVTEGGVSRGITFFAPEKSGEYKFFDSENKERREGIMEVK